MDTGERANIHGVHGRVAGDGAVALVLALVELNVDGRLSIVGNLKHAILDLVPDGLHGVGVGPHRLRGQVDWHLGLQTGGQNKEKSQGEVKVVESGADASRRRRRRIPQTAEQTFAFALWGRGEVVERAWVALGWVAAALRLEDAQRPSYITGLHGSSPPGQQMTPTSTQGWK